MLCYTLTPSTYFLVPTGLELGASGLPLVGRVITLALLVPFAALNFATFSALSFTGRFLFTGADATLGAFDATLGRFAVFAFAVVFVAAR